MVDEKHRKKAVNERVSLPEQCRIIKERLKLMTKNEVLETFVDAGILTKKGNVRKPYRGVIKGR